MTNSLTVATIPLAEVMHAHVASFQVVSKRLHMHSISYCRVPRVATRRAVAPGLMAATHTFPATTSQLRCIPRVARVTPVVGHTRAPSLCFLTGIATLTIARGRDASACALRPRRHSNQAVALGVHATLEYSARCCAPNGNSWGRQKGSEIVARRQVRTP